MLESVGSVERQASVVNVESNAANLLLDDIFEGSTKVEDGDPLNPQLASLADDLWLMPHDLKALYEKHRRPENTVN